MGIAEIQTPNQIEVILENMGKPLYYVGHVSKYEIREDNIQLGIKERPGHVWLGWPISEIVGNNVKIGNIVRVDFNLDGFAVGIHKLTHIRGLSLWERLKFQFLKHL